MKKYYVPLIAALVIIAGFLVLEWQKFLFNQKRIIADTCAPSVQVKTDPEQLGSTGIDKLFTTNPQSTNYRNFNGLDEKCLEYFENK